MLFYETGNIIRWINPLPFSSTLIRDLPILYFREGLVIDTAGVIIEIL
jgi:hypothetical protein